MLPHPYTSLFKHKLMAFTMANHIFHRASVIKHDGMLEKSICTEFIEDIRTAVLQGNLELHMGFTY